MTAVVGPNGSGKSNVADAIRWVTGEQSNKNLRSKKGEDVIFCGSEKKARSSYSEVSIVLADKQPVKFELNNKTYELAEIEITRKLYRNGDGEYLINRKRVRLGDIQQLLASLGFGQSSYTVIGQGMVDRLLFFTATERKVLFDEAAGVKQYEIKREQSMRKLEQTDANLIRLTDILSELEPRVTNLRRLVKRSEGRRDVERELKDIQERYYGGLLTEYQTSLKESEEKKKELNTKIVQYSEKLSDFETKLGSVKENPYANEKSKLENNISEITSERDRLLQEVAYLRGQIESVNVAGVRALQGMEALQTEQKSLLEKVEFLANRIKEERVGLSKANNEVDLKNKEIASVEKDLKALTDELENPKDDESTMRAKEIESQISVLESQKSELNAEIFSIRKEQSLKKAQEEGNKSRVKRLENEIAALEQNAGEKKGASEGLIVSLNEFTTKKKSLEGKSRKAVAEIEHLERSLAELSARISDESISEIEKDIVDLRSENEKIVTLTASENSPETLKSAFVDFGKKINQVFDRFSLFTKAANPKERTVIEGKLRDYRAELEETTSELSEVNIHIAKYEANIQLIGEQINNIEKRASELNAEITELAMQTGESVRDTSSLEKEMATINDKLSKLGLELKKHTGAASERQNVILREKNILNDQSRKIRHELYTIEMDLAKKMSIIENQEQELARSQGRLGEIEKLQTEMAKTSLAKADAESEKSLSEKKKLAERADEDLAKLRGGLVELSMKEREYRENFYSLEKEKRLIEEQKSQIHGRISAIELESAKVSVRLEDLQADIETERIILTENKKYDYLDQMEKDVLKLKIENMKRKLESIGGVDPETEAEYHELEARASEMSTQVEDLTKAKSDLGKVVKELDERIKKQFASAFTNIAEQFNSYFTTLFNGGNASLNLGEDEEGNFGIEIKANPPGKKVQSLNALSGGERTLTSLALLFAILSVNPSPFVMLDEVDAALDESNTLRFVKILEKLAHKTQFIVITHNRDTMKVANSLYGVTMNDEHVSKLLSVKLTEALVSARN